MQLRTIRRLSALALVFGSVAVPSAQDRSRQEFNGTWHRVDQPAASAASAPARPVARRVLADGRVIEVAAPPAATVPAQITYQLTDTSLIVKASGRPDVMYTLDNKEKKSEITAPGGKVEVTIKSRWEGAKIVTTETQKAIVEGELRMTESRTTRSLEKDGRLIVTMEVSGGPGGYKAIYTKQPAQP